MSMFDVELSKVAPFTTPERMVSALSVKVTSKEVSHSGVKYTAKIKDATDRTIVPSVNVKSGEWVCSCEDFHFRKIICKHVIALILYLKESKTEDFNSFLTTLGRPEFKRYATNAPTGFLSFQSLTLNALTKGGLPLSIVTGYVGNPKIGKTWLAYQTAVSSNLPPEKGGLGRPALYLSVEADFLKSGTQERFYKYFKDRFKQDFKIDFLFPRSIKMLFELFGLGINLKKTEKKVTPTIWDDTDPLDSPIAHIQRRMKYGVVIVDSLTAPLKKSVPVPPNQNISSRAACVNTIWGRFESLVEDFGIAMVVTHHCTRDPLSKAYGDPYGGDTIMYNMKHVVHLIHGDKIGYEKWQDSARRVLRSRWPGLTTLMLPIILAVNAGFCDPTDVKLEGV